MADAHMPAAEVTVADALETERVHYEFAFHVLPTVADGEVSGVHAALREHITKLGGEITEEEAPQRIDLAYEIEKHIEGKNRRFTSAYFGWIRFTLEPSALETLTEELDAKPELLRYLVVKLTRAEAAQPFYYHAAAAEDTMVTNVEETEVVPAESAALEQAEAAAPSEQTDATELKQA